MSGCSRGVRFAHYPLLITHYRFFSPALGLHIVHVGMLADLDVGDRFSDVEAVLDDGVAPADRAGGELVPDRDVVERFDLQRRIVLHQPAGQLLPGLDALDDDDADGILLVVNQEMNHFDPREEPARSGAGPDWSNRKG